jgi:hypothetical protein
MVSLKFIVDITFQTHYDPGVNSDCNRNEHKKYLLGVKEAGE